jgi:TolA-binding protein
VTTGVIEIHRPVRVSQPVPEVPAQPETTALLEQGYTAVRAGNLTAARAAFEHFLLVAPSHSESGKARSALDAVARLIGLTETYGNG